MNLRHVGLAGLVIASVAVSACSNGAASETRSWPTPSPVGVTETVGETAPQFVWQDVTGQGRTAPRDSNPKSLAQYGSTPAPGIQVQHVENGEMHVCTVGPSVVSTSGRPGFLTAGHCSTAEGGPQQWLQPTPDGDPTPLAAATGSGEAVAVWTAAVPASATRIADTWDVAGVLTAKGVAQLVPLDSYVCIDGAVSGVKCGPRVADEDGMVTYAIPTKKGDSGAPVFVVDSATHRAALIGIHQAGDGSTRGGATLIDPALLATGAAAKFASGVAPFDAPQPGLFSLRFSQ